ncbi:proline-rich protein PRCC [Halyomorpha halys]|uniref:proline-rich protein PRCC n=1 Tax=Halyomorpha halys TaxID=286706 RepID=UPI0006D4E2E1|nr:proline-rich protein PRCC [Halyomorpha halys]
MPLVDYGSSDDSDSDSPYDEKNDNELKKHDLSKNNQEEENSALLKETSNDSSLTEAKLFAQLPVPKSTFSLGEDALRLLSKNKNQPVKILLPSLSDLQSADNEESKKKKPSTKGSGLFALLPAPRNVNNFVPKSITNKLNNSNKPKPFSKVKQLQPTKSTAQTKYDEEDDEHDENPSSFFFSASDDIALPEAAIDEQFTDLEQIKNNSSLMAQLSTTVDMPMTNSGISSERKYPSYSESESETHMIEAQNNQDFSNLDDEAIEKLCGTRARKRKGEIPEEVIDINVDSMVGDAYMWLSKDLTKGHEHKGYKKAKNLSVVERRKHQITYLASQAKEKEMELRNQWANSRMTRKQTQSKYGF